MKSAGKVFESVSAGKFEYQFDWGNNGCADGTEKFEGVHLTIARCSIVRVDDNLHTTFVDAHKLRRCLTLSLS